MGFPGGSDGKESACTVGDLRLIPGLGRFPWRREWQPAPAFLPGESYGQRSLQSYSSWGCKESDTTKRLSVGTLPKRNLAPVLDSTGKALDWVNLFHVHIQ